MSTTDTPTVGQNIDLTGQVALVTGGGRGLGRVFAQTLAQAGASVAVMARSQHQLAETVASIGKRGGRALALPVDVRDCRALEQSVQDLEQQLGPVDLLVNNAGIVTPLGPAWEVDPDAWWQSMAINLYGPFLCARAVLPGMIARGRGRIINIASAAARGPIPFGSAYVVAKAALVRFAETLASETDTQGVRVFVIEPGTVRTAMSAYLYESPEGQTWTPWFRRIFDEGQDVPADRSAQLVLYLASGQADVLSGRFLSIEDDVIDLVTRAEEIVRDDLYTLRLRTPPLSSVEWPDNPS